MKKKYTCFTDLHKHGAYDDSIQKTPLEYGENIVFLGDNFDIYCKKENIRSMEDAIKTHKIKCAKTKTINVTSNHEGVYANLLPISHVENGICFTHGHYQDYSLEKVFKWEARTAGISKFQYFYTFWGNRALKYIEVVNIPYKKLAEYARLKGCSVIVTGHFHLNSDRVIDGIRVITLDRGRWELEL